MLAIEDYARFALYTEILNDGIGGNIHMFNMFGTFEECKEYAIELLNEGNGDRYIIMRYFIYDADLQINKQVPVMSLRKEDEKIILE